MISSAPLHEHRHSTSGTKSEQHDVEVTLPAKLTCLKGGPQQPAQPDRATSHRMLPLLDLHLCVASAYAKTHRASIFTKVPGSCNSSVVPRHIHPSRRNWSDCWLGTHHCFQLVAPSQCQPAKTRSCSKRALLRTREDSNPRVVRTDHTGVPSCGDQQARVAKNKSQHFPVRCMTFSA